MDFSLGNVSLFSLDEPAIFIFQFSTLFMIAILVSAITCLEIGLLVQKRLSKREPVRTEEDDLKASNLNDGEFRNFGILETPVEVTLHKLSSPDSAVGPDSANLTNDPLAVFKGFLALLLLLFTLLAIHYQNPYGR